MARERAGTVILPRGLQAVESDSGQTYEATNAGSGAAEIAAHLGDENFYVRYEAAHFMCTSHTETDAQHGETLAHMMQHDASRLCRHEAAKALTNLGTHESVKYIKTLCGALSDSEMLVRRDAAKALSDMGPAAASCANELANLLDDEFWPVRLWVARALMHFGVASAAYASKLVSRAVDDEEHSVREACAQTIGSLGEKAAPFVKDLGARLIAVDDEGELTRIEEALVIILGDPDLQARKQALKGLEDFVYQAKDKVANTLNRSAGLGAEAKAKEHHEVEILEDTLQDEDWVKRRNALHSLRSHVRGTVARSEERFVLEEDDD